MIESLNGVASIVAVALAGVFLVAAVTKIIAPETTSREFRQLGLPGARMLARLVPPLELLVAVALVLTPSIGALLAAAALVAFTAVLASALRAGREVSCGCLGSLSSQQVSWVTVARNVVLMAMAALAGTTPQLVRPGLDSVITASMLMLISMLVVHLLAMWQSIGRIWSVQLAGEVAGSQASGGKQR